MTNKVFRIWLAGSVFLLANGCGTSPNPLYYRLSSIPARSDSVDSRHSVYIRVGPVTIPEELDRSPIVTQTGTNTVNLAEYHRWAGDLQRDIGRVLGENLSVLLPTSHITLDTEVSMQPIDLRITVNIREFGGQLEGPVKLVADWSIVRVTDKKSIAARRSVLDEMSDAPVYSGFVAAQSRLLARLSQILANEVKKRFAA